MLIYVASLSPYKLGMVTEVALDLFGLDPTDLVVHGFDIPSGVADYPRTGDDLERGALNRMAILEEHYPDADYSVAQQGGAMLVGRTRYESGIVLVRNRAGVVTSAVRTGIPISPAIEQSLLSSSSPMDIIVKNIGERHEGGYAGFMTGGRISAYQTYKTATIVAFQAHFHA